MSTDADTNRIEIDNIHKRFGTVEALRGVDLDVKDNEILGLVGDNGAGKSTLLKVLVGIHQADEGEIRIDGEPVKIEDPKHARRLGLGVVYQDLALVDQLSVSENIFLGRNPVRKVAGFLPFIDKERRDSEAARILRERLDMELDPETPVEYLSGGQRQAIAIGRALVTDPEIILLDEPTSALSKASIEHVKDLITSLQNSGHTVIIVNHNLEEIVSMTDRIAVLYQGKIIDIVETDAVTRDDIVSMMISGQPLEAQPEGGVADLEEGAPDSPTGSEA